MYRAIRYSYHASRVLPDAKESTSVFCLVSYHALPIVWFLHDGTSRYAGPPPIGCAARMGDHPPKRHDTDQTVPQFRLTSILISSQLASESGRPSRRDSANGPMGSSGNVIKIKPTYESCFYHIQMSSTGPLLELSRRLHHYGIFAAPLLGWVVLSTIMPGFLQRKTRILPPI